MENMSNMYSDLYSDDDEEDAGENPLTSDEITAAQKLIKDGQIYLIDAEKEVTPVIISYDKSTWSAEDTVCQAYATLTANSGSEMDIQYEQGDASAAKEQIETSLTAYQSFFAGDGVTISDMKDFTCGGYTGQYFTTVYDMDDEKQSLVIATISVEDGYLMVTYMEDGKALTDKELEKVASSLFEKIAPVQKEV
jgi:hypothetical protein